MPEGTVLLAAVGEGAWAREEVGVVAEVPTAAAVGAGGGTAGP
jgi:hypothetical protein